MIEWRVEASESAVGAHEAASDRALSIPWPARTLGAAAHCESGRACCQCSRRRGAKEGGGSFAVNAVVRRRVTASKGGPVPELCALTKHIWKACEEQHDLTLHPKWVPRERTLSPIN